MNAYARSADTYLRQRILGAGPEQQAALIMEAGQLHLGKAIQALSSNDLPAATRSFLRVSEVLLEANIRLNHEAGGEVVENLNKLYEWWTKEIMVASATKDTVRLAAVVHGMGEIRQAWEQLHEQTVLSAKVSTLQFREQVV